MRRDIYPSCEANGLKGAERAADRHRPGGDLYRPGNRVRIEHDRIPSGDRPILAPPSAKPNPAIASSSKTTTNNHSLCPAACGAFSVFLCK